MQQVSVTREFDVTPAAVRTAMADLESFMRAGGFETVDVDGDMVHLENSVGLFFLIELDLEVVDRDGVDVAYKQGDGIFSSMETRYVVEPLDDGDRCRVTATTEFELDVAFAGPLLDASVVTRMRRLELGKQFDYLEADAA